MQNTNKSTQIIRNNCFVEKKNDFSVLMTIQRITDTGIVTRINSAESRLELKRYTKEH